MTYNLKKYHAKKICDECNEIKTLFETHPCDSKSETVICSDCSNYIQGLAYEAEQKANSLTEQRNKQMGI